MLPPNIADQSADEFRAVMGNMPTGVTVVTAADDGIPAGCTVNAVISVSMEPPSLLVSMSRSSTTLRAVVNAGMFGVNVLSWAQRDLCRHFAVGPTHKRFESVAHDFHMGVPVLAGAAASIVCTVEETIDVADHTLVIGSPVWQDLDHKAHPMVWFRRGLLPATATSTATSLRAR